MGGQVAYKPSPWGERFHNLTVDEALAGGSAGPGKALAVDTVIPTPSGWKAIGLLRVGDEVFDERGRACSVIKITSAMRGHRCFRVVFDDGSEIVADAEHQWLTMDYRERQSLRRQEQRTNRTGHWDQRHKCLRPKARTTEEIAASVSHLGRVNHAVMLSGPLCLPETTLLVDPYILGVWLGDGTSADGNVTTADIEIVEALCAAGFPTSRGNTKDKYVTNVRGLSPLLRRLGLNGSRRMRKHVPPAYLRASEMQRLDLLQGLVDTDGHIDRDGRCEISLCEQGLAEDVYELVVSLGLKATFHEGDAKLYGRVVNKRWRIAFSPQGKRIARLARKAKRIGVGQRTQRWRYVVACEPVESVPVCCIGVDSPSHLYLAGRSMIPTHNTEVLIHECDRMIAIEHQRCSDRNHPHAMDWGHSSGWALFLRRTRTTLEQTIVRALTVFKQMDPAFKWDSQKNIGTFKSGFRFQFGHCQNKNDWIQYYGQAYVALLFDELTEFYEEQYVQLRSRVRSKDPVLRPMKKTRSASNPVVVRSAGETFAVDDPTWVRRYFVDPAPEGFKILRRKLDGDRGEDFGYATRMYCPATVDDNPDPAFVADYKRQLAALPAHIRKALLYGDWYVTVGSYFGDVWNPNIHVVPPFRVPRHWKMFRSMDWGFKNYGAILWWAISEEGNLFCVREITFKGKYADDVVKIVRDVEQSLGCWAGERSLITGPADTQAWQIMGMRGLSVAEEFARLGVPWVRTAKNSKVSNRQLNAHRISKRLSDHHQGTTTPGLVFFETCKNTIRTIPSIQADRDDMETPADGGEDHWYDAVTYAVEYVDRGPQSVGMSPVDREAFERRALRQEAVYDRGADGYGGDV